MPTTIGAAVNGGLVPSLGTICPTDPRGGCRTYNYGRLFEPKLIVSILIPSFRAIIGAAIVVPGLTDCPPNRLRATVAQETA